MRTRLHRSATGNQPVSRRHSGGGRVWCQPCTRPPTNDPTPRSHTWLKFRNRIHTRGSPRGRRWRRSRNRDSSRNQRRNRHRSPIMATQEDALRLAVEAVDKFSGPLHEMTKSFHQFSGRGQVWSGEKSPPRRDRAEGEELARVQAVISSLWGPAQFWSGGPGTLRHGHHLKPHVQCCKQF